MNGLQRLVLLVGMMAILLLAGCSGDFARGFWGLPPDTTPHLDESLPPAYCAGFQAGYQSAMQPSRFAKDLDAYKSDDLYKDGWDDGHQSGVIANQQQDEWQQQEGLRQIQAKQRRVERDIRNLEHQREMDKIEAIHRENQQRRLGTVPY